MNGRGAGEKGFEEDIIFEKKIAEVVIDQDLAPYKENGTDQHVFPQQRSEDPMVLPGGDFLLLYGMHVGQILYGVRKAETEDAENGIDETERDDTRTGLRRSTNDAFRFSESSDSNSASFNRPAVPIFTRRSTRMTRLFRRVLIT